MSKRLHMAILLGGALSQVASALPTMVRLGYSNCSACHIAPQGGGLLNQYGRSVDRAQSLVGGEYSPLDTGWTKALNLNGRMVQDVRSIIQQQDVSTTGKPGTQLFRSRVMYRNVTELGRGWRFTATVTGENEHVRRPALAYDPPSSAATVFVNTLLASYKVNDALEFDVGRDQLPTGVNITDLGTFIRARNRLGYYDAVSQVKVFWSGKRFLITPYGYAPGGNEAHGQHESGGGVLAEFDLLGNHRTIVGVNALHGTAALEDRTMIGPYARLGFGKWGILAEHDIAARNVKIAAPASFKQSATYAQVFWAVREWLVPSLILERLRVGAPYAEHLDAIKIELAARLTPQITVSVGPRLQRDELNGRVAQSVVFQVALKTAK